MQKELADHQANIDYLTAMSEKLQKVVVPEDAIKIKQIADDDREKYEHLKLGIEEKARTVIMGHEKVEAFNSEIDRLSAWLDDKTAEHRNLEPVAVGADTIKEQLTEHQVLYGLRSIVMPGLLLYILSSEMV